MQVSVPRYEKFTRPAPQRVNATTLSELEKLGNRNNVIALEIQRLLHQLQVEPGYHGTLRRWTRGNLRNIQGMTYDGLYPTNEHLDGLEASLRSKDGEIHEKVRTFRSQVKAIIDTQEQFWKNTGYEGGILRAHQDLDAIERFIEEHGGRILVFGSARKSEGTPEYDAAQWLTQTIVGKLQHEDGTTEQVISGAGPGIMEAANRGAMEAAWERFQAMQAEFKRNPSEELHMRMLFFRHQMQSVGVRIELEFETGWNDHLQSNLSINSFPQRKQALILAASGREHYFENGNESKWEGRHPAIFVFPGGMGTRDEVWEAVCLEQCQKMPKIPIITVGESERAIAEFTMEQMQDMGTISPGDEKLVITATDEVDAARKYLEWHGIEPTPELELALRDRTPTIVEKAPSDEANESIKQTEKSFLRLAEGDQSLAPTA